MRDILDRIERETGVAELDRLLAERLSPGDLQSLLLEVFRRRAAQRTPAEVLADYTANRFAQPASADARALFAWEQVVLAQLPPDFTPLELSPVCPLGTSSAVATVSQNKVLTTSRPLEVVSDATNVLALECAVRRQALLREDPRSRAEVKLAASHRVLRTQVFGGARSRPHFRLLHLVTAGRDTGTGRFETAALADHLRAELRMLRAHFGPERPFRVAVTDLVNLTPHDRWRESVIDPLGAELPNVEFGFDQARASGRGYYEVVCFKLHVREAAEWVEIGDGGAVDWTRKLVSNAKERLFISALGSERLCGLTSPAP